MSPSPGIFRRGQQWPSTLLCLRRPHFWTPKNGGKNRWGDPRPPYFVQLVWMKFATAVPLNHRFLRASDLRRVSGPASAVALLKGQMNLFSTTNCLVLSQTVCFFDWFFPPARSPRSTAAAAYATNMPPACLLHAAGPSGEVGKPPHRLRGASRPAVFQWQPGISLAGVRLDKSGSGVTPALFW